MNASLDESGLHGAAVRPAPLAGALGAVGDDPARVAAVPGIVGADSDGPDLDVVTTHARAPEVERLTEADVLAMLRARYATRNGNGPRWAFASHVRDRAGFNATRTLDGLAMDTWPSNGLALHGFEIKTSRSDFRRELARPEKAAAFVRFLDHFWIVAPPRVVKDGELPAEWGLLEVRGVRLVQRVRAPKLDPEPVDRSFLACIFRAACYRA